MLEAQSSRITHAAQAGSARRTARREMHKPSAQRWGLQDTKGSCGGAGAGAPSPRRPGSWRARLRRRPALQQAVNALRGGRQGSKRSTSLSAQRLPAARRAGGRARQPMRVQPASSQRALASCSRPRPPASRTCRRMHHASASPCSLSSKSSPGRDGDVLCLLCQGAGAQLGHHTHGPGGTLQPPSQAALLL